MQPPSNRSDRTAQTIVAILALVIVIGCTAVVSYKSVGASAAEAQQASALSHAADDAALALRVEQKSYEDAALLSKPMGEGEQFEAAMERLTDSVADPRERATVAEIVGKMKEFDDMGERVAREYDGDQRKVRLLDAATQELLVRLAGFKATEVKNEAGALKSLASTGDAHRAVAYILASLAAIFAFLYIRQSLKAAA